MYIVKKLTDHYFITSSLAVVLSLMIHMQQLSKGHSFNYTLSTYNQITNVKRRLIAFYCTLLVFIFCNY